MTSSKADEVRSVGTVRWKEPGSFMAKFGLFIGTTKSCVQTLSKEKAF